MGAEDKVTISDVAYADIAADGTLNGAINLTGAGAAPPNARTGAGDYSVTLGEAVDELECHIEICGKTAALSWTVVHTSDTVKQILFLDTATGAAATNSAFSITVKRIN